jgi:hypothetical protein
VLVSRESVGPYPLSTTGVIITLQHGEAIRIGRGRNAWTGAPHGNTGIVPVCVSRLKCGGIISPDPSKSAAGDSRVLFATTTRTPWPWYGPHAKIDRQQACDGDMSGVEGVLGAIGTAISIINYVQGKLQKSRRQGKAIDDLRPILQLLEEILGSVDEEGNEDIIGTIEKLVREVTELINDNPSHRARALTFLWTSSAEEDVQRITNALTVICHTLGLRERYENDDHLPGWQCSRC